jgi:NADH-quinone oxidoreductase subunit L
VPWLLLVATAFLTAFYMGRVVFVAFFGKASSEAAEHAHEPGWSMRAPLVVLCVLALSAGFFATPFARLYGQEYHFHLTPGAAVAALMGIAGMALSYAVFGRGKRETAPAAMQWVARVAQGRAVNRFYEFGYRRVTLALADGMAWIDRYVVDGVINWIGYRTIDAGRRVRPLQTGYAPDYVLAVVLGAVSVAAWAVLR